MTIGIASWRGRGVSFTDGMCRGCAIRFRRQWNLPEMPKREFRLVPAPVFLRGAVTVAMAVVLIVIVRASDSSRTASTTTPPLTATVILQRPVVATAPTITAPAPRAPRRGRAVVSRPAPARTLTVAAVPTRPVPPAPSRFFPEPEIDADAIVLTSLAESTRAEEPCEPTRATSTWSRYPAMSLFAALPHAGLTQQAP